MTEVLDRPVETPERQRDDDAKFCHVLRDPGGYGRATYCGRRDGPALPASAVRNDVGGYCTQGCGLRRCPACMEFLT